MWRVQESLMPGQAPFSLCQPACCTGQETTDVIEQARVRCAGVDEQQTNATRSHDCSAGRDDSAACWS